MSHVCFEPNFFEWNDLLVVACLKMNIIVHSLIVSHIFVIIRHIKDAIECAGNFVFFLCVRDSIRQNPYVFNNAI